MKLIFAMLVAGLTAGGAFAQKPIQPPASSVESSPNSARSADERIRAINARAAAAEELKASSELIALLENQNTLLKQRLSTEERRSAILAELNKARGSETDALQAALAAKDKDLDSKDAVIASQAALIAELKRRKSSIWKRLGDVLIGVAAGALIR